MVSLGRWRLFWWFERPQSSAELIPCTSPVAWQWMRSARRGNDALPVLRRLLAQNHPVSCRVSDDGLIKLLGNALATRRLLVYEWRPAREGGGTNTDDSPPANLAPAFPLEERRTSSGPSEPPPDAALFPENAELVAIAAVLTAAAEDGVPFCEECAKAAAARRGAT